MIKNNQVRLIGTVSSKFTYNHSMKKEDFYSFDLSITRLSGNTDTLPVIVSSKIFDVSKDLSGYALEVIGSFRSHNHRENGIHQVKLYVFADSVRFSDEADFNEIVLDGHICLKPIYRTTTLGREITNTCIAVNRNFGKSDYLPVIFWSRNAMAVFNYPVSTHLSIRGRLQSRPYNKFIDNIQETRIAYEVSASEVEVIYGQAGETEAAAV